MRLYARVVFPLPLVQSFLYAVPERYRDAVRPGVRIVAPLGTRRRNGFVVGLTAEGPGAGIAVKELAEVLDERPFRDERFLEFTGALSEEFHSPWGEILQASLPPSMASRPRVSVRLTDLGRERLEKGRLGPREKAVADILLSSPRGRTPLALRRRAGGRDLAGLLARMRKKGYIETREEVPPPPRPSARHEAGGASQLGLEFPEPASEAGPLTAVERCLESGRFGAFCLVGPDAIRKAAYRTLIERATRGPGKVLYLVPEIVLTRAFAAGFEEEFGRAGAVFHGRMTERQKEDAWRALRSGRAALVVGTRSALFIEAAPLRLIIVDGEHEDSYFQPESPSYDARRGAWLRARAAGAAVVLGSSRPTVEAYDEARRRGVLIELGSEPRRNRLTWVEPRRDGPLVSQGLEARIRAALEAGRPAVLFLNRRGYAGSPVCARCGRAPRCPRCDIPLVYHKTDDRLICHYCGFATDVHGACSACGGRLAFSRPAGIQALEEDLRRLFPAARVARFDADTASKAGERERILEDFRRGKVPLLVGTQLLAHQPAVAKAGFVGILGPEALLGLSDYRAAQRTFQTVAAMMDLCRNEPEAEAVVQTLSPVHYSIQAAAEGDYRGFVDKETAFRRLLGYPPSGALAEVFLQGRDMRALAGGSRRLAARLKQSRAGLEVLGPVLAPAPRAPRGSGVQFILKAKDRGTIDRALHQALPDVRQKKKVVFSYSPFREE